MYEKKITSVFIIDIPYNNSSNFSKEYGYPETTSNHLKMKKNISSVDDSDVVNISDFLPENPEKAKAKSFVSDPSILPGISSWSGFATVDKIKKNHLFWWYLAPQNVDKGEKFEVLLWLQGGPGASSIFGLFSEFGPYKLYKDNNGNLNLEKRKVHWGDKFGLLIIDNPVGTGFSFTETGTYCNSTRTEVSDQLYNFLEQFYQVFPELLDQADFYVTGESYAGHYVSGLSSKLSKMIQQGNTKIPFKGCSMGNAWVDPINQIKGYPAMLYNLDLITSTERKVVQKYCDNAVDFIKKGEYSKAFLVWDEMINGDLYGYPPYITNVTGLTDYFNYLNTEEPVYENYFSEYVQLERIRKGIHVGNRPFGETSKKVEEALRADFMVSFKSEVENLLALGYKVLIYNGQLDVIIGPALTRNYLKELNWPGKKKHHLEQQHIWRLNKNDKLVLGYIKQAEGLTSAVVRGASHMVPSDKPEAALDLITRFIKNKPFN